jgi:copper chaperone CopZ
VRAPTWVVPALVVAFAALGVGGARLLAVPTVVKEFPGPAPTALRVTTLVVDGVKCADTAERAAAQLEGVPGLARFSAYASRHRVEVAFDPSRTSPEAIRAALEGPVYDPASGEFRFGVYRVAEMDGLEIPKSEP